MKVEVKVGLFVLAALTLFMFGAIFLGNISFGKSGYAFFVQFDQSAGLRVRSKVKMGGGEDIGYVEKIAYDREAQRINVRVKIFEGVGLYKDSTFSIGSSNMLGDKFINVTGGHKASGLIAGDDIVKGFEGSGLDGAMTKATDVMVELEKVLISVNTLMGNQKNKNAISDSLTGVSRTIQESHPKVIAILDNLETATKSLSKAAGSFSEMSATANKLASEKNQQAMSATLENLKNSTEKLSTTLGQVSTLTAKLNASEGPVGVLLNDKKMGEDLKAMMKDLRANPSILLWGPKKP